MDPSIWGYLGLLGLGPGFVNTTLNPKPYRKNLNTLDTIALPGLSHLPGPWLAKSF